MTHSLLVPLLLFLLVAGLLYALFLRGKSSARSKSRSLMLLVGPSGSGKTTLFTLLMMYKTTRDLPPLGTWTSQTVNRGLAVSAASGHTPMTVWDMPGHERLAFYTLEALSSASCIAFVLDGSTLSSNVGQVSSKLYDILSDKSLAGAHIKLLMLVTRQDSLLVLSIDKVRSLLEKELTLIRKTRASSAAVFSQDDTGSEGRFLGLEDRDFAFEDLDTEDVESVDWMAVSLVDQSSQEKVLQWMME